MCAMLVVDVCDIRGLERKGLYRKQKGGSMWTWIERRDKKAIVMLNREKQDQETDFRIFGSHLQRSNPAHANVPVKT